MRSRMALMIAAAAMLMFSMAIGRADDKVTISFLHKWPEPQNMKFFQQAVDEFEKTHPNITIKMDATADEPYKDKIRVLMASGQVPDIYFSWSGEFGRKFARGGRALDITDAVYGTDWKNRLPESALDAFKFNGRLYGIPINVDAKFMMYNKAIFAKYGLEKPKSWSEFEADLKKLKDAGVTPIAFGNQFPWAAIHYIGDLNAKYVPAAIRRADYDMTTPDDKLFTDPGYVQALTTFGSLQKDGYFNRGSNALSHEMARGMFNAGHTAMMYLELVEFVAPADSQVAKDGWDVFTLPPIEGAQGDQALITGAPDGFMVASTTQHPKEALEFLQFLTSPEQAKQYVQITGMTSSVKGTVSAETANAQTVEGLDMLNQAPGLALWLDTDVNAKVADAYLTGSQAIINGTETPEAVMAKVRAVALQVKHTP
jgi:raffinose/stachyose/melibiose transport system substrate-binding protein